MDPLSAGASVLAFVGILNSLQLVYETLSSIKDGPENVRLVANSVGQLRSIVKQLQRQQSLTDLDGEAQLKQCADDVDAIANKLARLHISPSEKRGGKIWKRIKAALSEKDFDRMNKVLSSHSSALSLRLIVQQKDVVIECRDQILLLKTDVAKRQDRAALQEDGSSSSGGNEVPPALQSQMDTMLQILRQLQAQTPTQPTNQPAVVEISDEDLVVEETTDGGDVESNVCNQLSETINELCVLIGDNERTIRSDDADDIMEKLEKLLSYAKSDQLQPIRGVLDPEDSDRRGELSRDIRRVSRHLMSSTRLSINEGVQKKALPAGIRLLRQQRQRREFDIGAGRLAISTTEWRHRFREGTTRSCAGDSDETQEADARNFSATLTFFPSKGSIQKRMLAMSIRQSELMKGNLLTIPSISVNRVRPRDSEVFSLVEIGDLDGLRRSFAQGMASVRDHDEHGRSLLSYATEQPDICKFLIECGLDVDHIAPASWDGKGELRVSLLNGQFYSDNVNIIQCRKLILGAGADPSIKTEIDGIPFSSFENIIDFGSPGSIKAFLDIGSYFIDIETCDVMRERSTPLLRHCMGLGDGYSRDVIALLLQRGANVHAVDTYGRSCLHLAIRATKGPNRLEEEFAALAVLVRSGADVRAEDDWGRSVSKTAYQGLSVDSGSYPGDLWDSVLAACGYQVSEFRRHYPRRARYTRDYPRRIFEKLWEGRQHLCPYWDEDRESRVFEVEDADD